MRKPKWQAKVFYLIIALAFAFGLAALPATPTAVAARDGVRIEIGFTSMPSDFAKAGQTVTFTGRASGVVVQSWEWDFGDGGKGEGPAPTHEYMMVPPDGTTFTVRMDAFWDGGSQTVRKDIRVEWGLITEPYSYSYDGYGYSAPAGIDTQIGYNVLKAKAIFWVPDAWANRVIAWHVLGDDGYVVAGGSTSTGLPGYPWDPDGLELPLKMCWIQVQSAAAVGEVLITADIDLSGPPETADFSLSATKKWGDIVDTVLDTMEYDYETGEWVYGTCPGESEVVWYEGLVQIPLPNDDGGVIEVQKQQLGVGYLRERVTGAFDDKAGGTFEHPADGAVVHMFLLDGNAPVHNLPQTEAEAFNGDWSATKLLDEVSRLQDLYPPRCVSFFDGDPVEVTEDGRLIHVTKVSGDIDLNGNGVFDDPEEMGLTGNILMAECEEAVKIVFVATYPYETGPELPVFAEICAWNFWTQQLEKVPQVHWAGEKIVLEKQFGSIYYGYPVLFNLENQSCGSLFPVNQETINAISLGDTALGSQQVLTHVDEYGVARAFLESQSPCEADIQCSLYAMGRDSLSYGQLINQAGWVIFFLKFEGITLSNVQGERTGHDSGLWDPVLASGVIFDAQNEDDYGYILVDPTEEWADNQFVGKTLKVWKGEWDEKEGAAKFIGDLQIGEIVANYEDGGTADVVVSTPPWDLVPYPPERDVQWYYEIVDPVWNPATDDLWQELNVSQDALLRARVKGWFMGDDLSWRDSEVVDLDGDGFAESRLPEGRWVLPDDWPILAGAEWEELRPHWDIMDQPNDNIMSKVDRDLDGWKEWGDYIEWTLNEEPDVFDVPGDLVAEAPVIGPYSALDTYTPYIEEPWKINYKTIIPNGKLNWWDCPMPPAKIVFKITDGAGFFKDADKGDIYYQWVHTDRGDGIAYTDPYYWEMIPGNPLIPAFVLNGGFDWDSWNDAFGPYPFWKIFNQLPGDTPSDPQHPTKVEVYSDNHGEAMVFLNGDWNLDLEQWQVPKDPPFDAYDVPTGTVVGDTVVKAIADYPYMRKHLTAVSNTVEKVWTWGKEIKGYSEWVPGSTTEKKVLVFVTDRDGQPVYGERIVWQLTSKNQAMIESYLPGTNGTDILGLGYPAGQSFTREPTPQEAAAFEAEFGKPCHHGVAGVTIADTLNSVSDLAIWFYEREGVIIRDVILDFNPGGADIFWDGAGDPLVPLAEGWNNVAWGAPNAPAVADAVAPLGDAFVAIWHYDAFTKEWSAYKAGAPDYANDNFNLLNTPAATYWIQVTRAIDWNQGT
jgi:hypothetical protein